MQPVKVLLLAALAATAFVAVVAAAPSGAVTLCLVNENPECAEGNRYRVPTKFEAKLFKANNAVFTGTPSVTCEESGGTGETTIAGTPLIGEAATVTFGSCTGGCTTVEARNLPWIGEVEATGGGNGTITVSSSGKGNPGVKMTSCLSGATCFYGTVSATAEIEGGSTGVFTVVKTLNREEGSSKLLCAATSTFSGTYNLVTPSEPIFISALP